MARTDTASRVVKAPLSRVFEALVDPDALAEWLPPSGMTGRFDHFEARPGGSYRMILTYIDPPTGGGKTDADSDVVEGRFLAIEPDHRVVQAVDFASDDPSFGGTMTMTWTVRRVDGGTRVELRADDVPPGISATDHEAGMNSSLDNLAAYLARHQTVFRAE
ncbi:SRPBCC family protein [Mycobacterium sp. IS-3022]|uniref:SRPBCC family protein n=1 Tax=Mycobacterium sp. IS-3022 TaxID=1772277 RepID=UPI00074183CB|nr:SRPBCC family protein [Mycobacterium sp. IS-3022]KUI02272.1 ATPase [Mycobacterium sp. IS-3022]